jgi:hypothetical protein
MLVLLLKIGMEMIRLPRHKTPILHENVATLSYQNHYKLGKMYKEIIGIDNVDHFSINVVDSNEKMSILSYNPQIAYDIFKDGSYLYNGSISPSYYNNFDYYTWDETYDPQYSIELINTMERKNGINKGVVIIKRIQGLTLLYSFATKGNGLDFEEQVRDQRENFYEMGNHCFNLIKPIVEENIIGFNLDSNNDQISEKGSNIIRIKKNV